MSNIQVEFQAALEKEQTNTLPLNSFQSDDLLEKLRLLNYEKLLREIMVKPFGKFYFVMSVNPGEQFYVFTSLCAWLIRKLGKTFEQPEEFDDPNQTIARIIKVLQEMDIPTDFPSNKLIQGAGPICLLVLDCLATQALKISKITLKRTEVKEEEDENVPEYFEDDSEIILEKLEEDENAFVSDDSDEGGNSLLDLNWTNKTGNKGDPYAGIESDGGNFNEVENWRFELERVLPQLKVVVKTDFRDWRAHLKQMETFKTNIDSTVEDTQIQLKKLQNDITFAMDKIESREKHLNNDLKTLISQHKEISVELSGVQGAIKDTEKEREKLRIELNTVINENEAVKVKMEQKGQTMSNGGPILSLKKAIAKLRDEISHINLEIGLLSHAIDQDINRQALLYTEIEGIPSSIS